MLAILSIGYNDNLWEMAQIPMPLYSSPVTTSVSSSSPLSPKRVLIPESNDLDIAMVSPDVNVDIISNVTDADEIISKPEVSDRKRDTESHESSIKPEVSLISLKTEINMNSISSIPFTTYASRNSCKTLKCPKCNWHYKVFNKNTDILW